MTKSTQTPPVRIIMYASSNKLARAIYRNSEMAADSANLSGGGLFHGVAAALHDLEPPHFKLESQFIHEE